MCEICVARLHDVLHSDKKLTLVFEYCDQDLKKYFDSCNGEIDPDTVKVNTVRPVLNGHLLKTTSEP